MQIWLELVSRELLFFVLLLALGSAPAAFLPERWGNTVRLALAPALGLCVGACLAVTLVYAFPARQTGWVVVVAALVSIAVSVRRGRPIHSPRLRSVAEVAIVSVVVLGSFSYPLAAHHTVGPAGGYLIGDAGGYINEIDSEQRASIREIERQASPFADLSALYWATYAAGDQQLDVSALEANVNSLLGLGATDTYSPFLITVVLAAALGAYAVVRAAGGGVTWPAVLAGCLFAGSLLTELFMDGSEAALAGVAVLAPLTLVGWEALQHRRTAVLVVLGLLAAGLATLYPLFVPCVVIGGLVAVMVVTARRLRRGRPARREGLVAGGQLLGVLALAALFSPEAFSRDVRYWTAVLNGGQSLAGLPGYHLPVSVLPGWVLQTREFYGLVDLAQANLSVALQSAAVPAVLIGLIALAVWRYRPVRLMLAIAGGGAVLAYYTAASQDCSYCVQRNLIPVAALAVPAVALGLVAFAALRLRGAAAMAVVIAAAVVVVVGHASVVEHRRLANGSYLLDPQVRQTVAALPARSGPIELEGFSEGPRAPQEQADVYAMVNERTHENVSLATTTDDHAGLFYLGGPEALGPAFKPDYRYVLTRLAGIATQRQIVSRRGPIALERRSRVLDVTITGGVSVASVSDDPSGTAWVTGPMQFLVVGGDPARAAWISLVLRRTVAVKVVSGPALASVRRHADELDICLRAAAAAPARGAGVQLAFTPQPPPAPMTEFGNVLPPRGVRLVSMSVASASCRR